MNDFLWPAIWALSGLGGIGVAYLISTRFFTKSVYDEITPLIDESFNIIKNELHAEPRLKSKMNEPFTDWSDIKAWAIRGKSIERALDKQGMDYIIDEKRSPV